MRVYCSRCGEQVEHVRALLLHWAARHKYSFYGSGMSVMRRKRKRGALWKTV